jgi:alkylation response protein AidB-like acyl-CoA dehydrogenase
MKPGSGIPSNNADTPPNDVDMNFALNEDQILIRDAAESFLGDVSDSAAVRRALDSKLGYDATVWQRIGGELGWCGVAIAEAQGGLGLGPVELVLIQEQAGRHLLCAPFYATVCVAATALQDLGSAEARERFLPRIAAGALRIALPLHSGREQWLASAQALQARRIDGHWVLDGAVPRLVDVAEADYLFVFATIAGGGLGLFAIVPGAVGLGLQPCATWDGSRRFTDVQLNSVRADIRIDEPHRASEGVTRTLALARLYLAAEQLGGAQQCLDLTVAYTATRKQFGRAVAGFQAVKHRCAEMMVKIEALRSAVYGAAATAAGAVDNGTLAMECAMARVLAADTYFWCAQEAIQLHGGVGFTWEYDPQLHFKRAQAASHWLGNADVLRAELADALLD